MGAMLNACSKDDNGNPLDDEVNTVQYTITADNEEAELIIFATGLPEEGVEATGSYTSTITTDHYFVGATIFCKESNALITLEIDVKGKRKHTFTSRETLDTSVLIKGGEADVPEDKEK